MRAKASGLRASIPWPCTPIVAAAVAEVLAWAASRLEKGPILIYATRRTRGRVARPGRSSGARRLAHDRSSAIAAIARDLVARGVRRFVVAGGETSGAVVSALGVTALEIGPQIAPGVPATLSYGEPRLCAGAQVGQFRRARFLHRSAGGPAVNETKAREFIAEIGRSMFERRLTFGSSGNISVRIDDGWLMTPTGSSLGRLDPAKLSKLDDHGQAHVAATHRPRKVSSISPCTASATRRAPWCIFIPPTRSRSPASTASTMTTCCRRSPPITSCASASCRWCPTYAPGDKALGEAVGAAGGKAHRPCCWPITARSSPDPSLSAAVDAIEELEETARLYLLLHGRPTRYLSPEQIADLKRRFPPA